MGQLSIMPNIKSLVSSTIDDNFEKSFFLDAGSEKTIQDIKNAIDKFDKAHQGLLNGLISKLTAAFPGILIENWSQLFTLDRCLRIMVQINEEQRYVCQVSVFNYFSVYQRSIKFENDRYEYGSAIFINKDESEVCDKIYGCLQSIALNQFYWLDRETLNIVIPHLSTEIQEIGYAHHIKIADVLFTEHRV